MLDPRAADGDGGQGPRGRRLGRLRPRGIGKRGAVVTRQPYQYFQVVVAFWRMRSRIRQNACFSATRSPHSGECGYELGSSATVGCLRWLRWCARLIAPEFTAEAAQVGLHEHRQIVAPLG